MKVQKYQKGAHVQVAKDLGQSMSHFASDCEAIVMYTYSEKFGGENIDSYCIHIKGNGQTSWYYECQLALIEEDRLDLLEQWEAEEKRESNMKSDLDWIFSNGKDVLASAHGATVEALAKCFGLTDLWGRNGEGMTYYSNAMTTLKLARPFLESGNKCEWLEFCKTIKTKVPTIKFQPNSD